jgi:hypothetical protein
MKPRLPREIELSLPADVVWYIYRFVPHLPPKKEYSPSLQKELTRIQNTLLHGKKETYLRELEEFVLD